jgi:hypothetical protein
MNHCVNKFKKTKSLIINKNKIKKTKKNTNQDI